MVLLSRRLYFGYICSESPFLSTILSSNQKVFETPSFSSEVVIPKFKVQSTLYSCISFFFNQLESTLQCAAGHKHTHTQTWVIISFSHRGRRADQRSRRSCWLLKQAWLLSNLTRILCFREVSGNTTGPSLITLFSLLLIIFLLQNRWNTKANSPPLPPPNTKTVTVINSLCDPGLESCEIGYWDALRSCGSGVVSD